MLPTGPGELASNLFVSWQIWGKIPKFRGVEAIVSDNDLANMLP